MAATGQLKTPYEYHFTSSKWPQTIRRKKLNEVSPGLFRLEGADVLLEVKHLNVNGLPVVHCRALDSRTTPGTERPNTVLACSTPSPFDRSTSSASSGTSSMSAFDHSYLTLAISELDRRESEYKLDIEAGWGRWPGVVEVGRRASLVNVIEDVITCYGGSPATAHVATFYLDAFFVRADPATIMMNKSTLRMLVCVSCLVACKHADIIAVTLSDLASIIGQWEGERPSLGALADMELLLLSTLEYRIHPPTVRDHVAARLALDDIPSSYASVGRAMWLADVALRLILPSTPSEVADVVVAMATNREESVTSSTTYIELINSVNDNQLGACLKRRKPIDE